MKADTPITLAAARYSNRDAAVDGFRHGLGRAQGRRVRSHRCRRAHQGRLRQAAGRAPRHHRQAPGVGRRSPGRRRSRCRRRSGGGRGALVGHFHHNIPKDDVEAIGELLESGQSGLIVVAVNQVGTDIEPLLAGAEKTKVVQTTWGDLDAEIDKEIAEAQKTAARSRRRRHEPTTPMDRQQRKAHAHGCSADPIGTAAGVAGVGADAGGRVHRSQRGAGGEGVRVVLPPGDRRRRVHAREASAHRSSPRSRFGSASAATR